MMQRTSLSMALLLSLGSSGLWAAAAPVQENAQAVVVPPQPSAEERISHIEQMLQNQSLLDMLSRIDALQQENRELRGELEVQTHHLNELKQQQSDLYRDLDRRVSDIERTASRPVATATSTAANPSADTPPTAAERDAYQKAFDMLRELRYEQAIEGFRGFLKAYPTGRYAPSAQYWLAEAYYARRDFPTAITEYQTLRSRFPSSTKTPEALLKIGYCYSVLGKKDEATSAFEELVKSYPQSPEAQQAEAGLQRLSGEAAKSR